MSRHQYNQIMTYGLRSRQKPSNPNKVSNFVGRIRGLKIFIGSFIYECDFMILEDTTSIIDRHLGERVFGRPFINETSLVYNDEEGTNGVPEKNNRTLVEAAITMLVDSKLPNTFWAEAVNTAYNYSRKQPTLIDYMKPTLKVSILVPLDLSKDTKPYIKLRSLRSVHWDFFVGYSVVSKAMRVFNKRTRIVEETLKIRFLENAPNVTENGPDWLFDIDSLTISTNYVPVLAGNQTNGIVGTRDNIVTGQDEKKTDAEQEYILIPFCTTNPLISQDGEDDYATRSKFERLLQQEKQTIHPNSTNSINTVSTAGPSFTNDSPSSLVNAARTFEEHLFEQFSPFKNAFTLPDVPNVFSIDDSGICGNAYDDEDVGVEAYLNNLETTMNASPIPTTRIDKDHPKDQIIREFNSAIQTRRMTNISDEHAMMSSIGELTFFLGLQVQQKEDEIFISQDKYVAEILKKFDFATVKKTSTPIETNKALVKDEEVEVVDVYLYKSMIGSLMYLTASRPDIMFTVCACARFQVTPKMSNLHATIVANSTTEAEYVAAANCCGQNPVFHSKTKHIEIRHQFIRDSYEKKLIQVIKIHTYHNVADLLTKAFDKPIIVPSSYQHKKTHKLRKTIRTTEISQSSRPINLVADEIVYKEWEDRMERAATTASSIEAEQDSVVPVAMLPYWVMQMLKLGLRLHLNSPMIHLSQEVSHFLRLILFWATTKVETVNKERQIQALVDKKKVIITETSIRSDLHLEDADGIDCLPTATIFEELARMGAKSTS
ncbi:uncharacterized mitochondrial protein-like protein [Tanacetum coccineum]